MNKLNYQELEDFEALRKIVNKEIDMSSISNETKVRLIELCDNRICEVNKKIDAMNAKLASQK